MDWAVVHTIHVVFPHRFVAELFVTDVPEDVTADQIRSALTRSGRRFGEFGVAWANHSLVPEPDWPDEVEGAYRTGEVETVTWDELAPTDQLVKATVRLPRELYDQVAAAAARAGQTINAFVTSALAAALAEESRN